MTRPLEATRPRASEAPADEKEDAASSRLVSEPAAVLWFNRGYDRYEADTLSDDSDLGWF